tara:strand:- start:612 stop:848 length:237 start_codon:yes stop_codon:yes gene_type:complete
MEWLTWGNAAYLIAIMLGGIATLVATKYKPALKELKEVAQKYNEAMADGKLSVKEKQELAKECMDVVSAVLKLFFWKL